MIGREKSGHGQTWLERRSSLNEKLQRKAELNWEIYKSWRKYWKYQVSFCHRSSPVSQRASALPWNLRSWKNTLGKLVVTVNLEGVSNGLWEHLRACQQCIYFCEREQWSIFLCEQPSLRKFSTIWNLSFLKCCFVPSNLADTFKTGQQAQS